jgi:hypothetical protein
MRNTADMIVAFTLSMEEKGVVLFFCSVPHKNKFDVTSFGFILIKPKIAHGVLIDPKISPSEHCKN